MKKVIVRFLVVLGLIYLVTIAATVYLLVNRKGKVPSKTVLEANFEQPFVEDIP